MGAQTLEARLTRRLLALTGAVVIAVGAASVVVIARMLDAGDSERACAQAKGMVDAFGAEIGEGDGFEVAAQEVVAAAAKQGSRARLRTGRRAAGDAALPALVPGARATFIDGPGDAWRACAAGDGSATAVAAVALGPHRAAVRALKRGMLAVVAVALAVTWLAIRRVLRQPIAELAEAVRWTTRILESESPDPPPGALTREVAQIEASFDALIRRLLGALAGSRAFSAHVAHELRTPLTALAAELEAVRSADASSREALDRARGDVARFAEVIDGIVVLSESFEWNRRERRLDRAIERTGPVVNLADLARELAPRDVPVDAPEEALVVADERLVRLALRNLIDNAGKHGGGARRVSVTREGDQVCLAVLDEGPGVRDDARERMFERYWRGAADGDGRGLGLALVRAVAERHGGGARAERGPAGRGLEVSMTMAGLLDWRDAR